MGYPLHRRRFLSNCGWVAFGAAGGLLLPRWWANIEPAIAQEKPASSAEEQLRKEMEEKRKPLLDEMVQRLKAEFSAQASPSPAAP